jgi:integrase
MKITKFTDTMIRNLKPEEKKYIRSEGNGFSIRVMPSGVKTWLYIYTFDGKRREMNLGNYPFVTLDTARNGEKGFEVAQRKVKNGVDPMAEKEQIAEERRKAPTVAQLIDEYISKHAKPNKRGWAEDQRILNKDALAAWGKRKAADIKKRDVVLLLESIVDRGAPGSANNNFKIIRKMFRFAVQRDIIEHSPCDGVVMPAPLNRGNRVLSETEIKTLWGNLDTCNASDEIKRAIRLILVTGQRPGEVIGMHTSEIELIIEKEKITGAWWTIPAERSKNKKAHRVFLTDTALDLIGSLKKIDKDTGKEIDRGFIFPCPKVSKDQAIAVNAIAHVVRLNMAAPVLVNGKPVFDKKGEPVTENKLGVADFTPHDLRRTAATFMSQLGFMDEVIDAVLNHTKQGIIRTYNLNRYDKEKQMALESWERKLTSIITGEVAGKVIPFRKAENN